MTTRSSAVNDALMHLFNRAQPPRRTPRHPPRPNAPQIPNAHVPSETPRVRVPLEGPRGHVPRMPAPRSHSAIALALCVLSTSACEEEEPAPTPFDFVEPLAAPSPDEGFQVSIHATAAPGTEIWKCEILPALPVLPSDPDALFHFVNSVQSRQNSNVHHADLMTLFYTGLAIQPGQYDCADLYAEHTELMEEGVIVYGAQLPDARLDLPEGVAASVPITGGYMLEVHYVNASTEPVDVATYINAYTMPAAEVVDTIAGDANRDFDIVIPPGAVDHVEWTRCVFTDDVDLLFLSSHTHALAKHFELRTFDGTHVADIVYANDDWHSPQILALDPPVHIAAGTGFEYSCVYDNPSDVEVNWGFLAEDEMCQFAYVFVGDSSIKCETVATSTEE